MCPPCWWHSRAGGGNGVGFTGGHHFHWSREAVLSRHDLAVVPMATVRPSATALGIYRHTFSGSRSPVAVCQRAALLIGLPALLTAAQVSYRVLPASVFHGWERPNIAGGLSCTAWELPCFWPLRVGGFRLYTLRRAQPLSTCRHTVAGHSCHRFRLHDRRAAFTLLRRITSALSLRYSVFPQS